MANSFEKKRNLGVDFLCCLAVMLLLGLHFIDSIGFADVQVIQYMDILPLGARWFCMSGAMLLAACTGFVLHDHKCDRKHFGMLVRLLYVYVVGSFGCIAIRKFVLQEEMEPLAMFQSLCNFSASPFSKVVGMYFGLVLAAPFLNAAFKRLKKQKARLNFVMIAAAVSTLQPILQYENFVLIPEWCRNLFPIAAYTGGLYIHRYNKQKEPIRFTLILLCLIVIESLIVFATSMVHGSMYCMWLDSKAALPSLLIALCMLTLFRSKHSANNAGTRFFSGGASGALIALMLGASLIECLVPALEERFVDISMRLWSGFGVVPMVFILCCTIGLILQIPVFLIRSASSHTVEEEETDIYEDEYEVYGEPIPDEAEIFHEEPETAEEKAPVPPAPAKQEKAPESPADSEPFEKPEAVPEESTDSGYVPRHMSQEGREAASPVARKEYSVDEILNEQELAEKQNEEEDSVDELIAAIENTD